jgi:ATP-dependent Zn protease
LLALRSTDPAELPHVLNRCLEKAREEPKPSVRSVVPLAEMAGLGAAKEAALEIVAALQAWKHGRLDWSAVPRGLLLAGEPGTGKTELARSLEGETAITLISASYSGWQKTGNLSSFQSAMERSFKEAQDNTPAVLFIDEVDAFHGRQHSDGGGHNDSYDAKVIAAFLEHLDGMAEREGVVVMGACNRLDRLDPAICRAGRFDTVIRMERPGLEDLAAILAQHLGPDAGRVDLPACAAAALGQTGADCAAAVRRARMKAMRGQREFCTADLLTALAGDGPGYSAEDEMRLAVHECGHAIVATALAAADVEYVRIDTQGGSCGFREGTALVTAEHLHQMRCVNLAGRAAEQLILGGFSTGAGGEAESDLALATRSAANQVVSFGLGSSGPIWFGRAGSGEAFREALNGHLPEVSELLDAAQETSLRILAANCDLLQKMAEKLISRRVLLGEDLDKCLSAVIAPHTRTQ